MSLDPIDPPRLGDDASEELRTFLRATREDEPGRTAMDRMTKRLAAAGALASLPSEQHQQPRVASRLAAYMRGFVALTVAGGLALSWYVTQSSMSEPSARAEASRSELVPNDPAAAAESPSAVRRADDPATPTLSIDQLPSAPAPAAPALGTASGANVRAPKPPTTAAPDNPGVVSELELLQRAQAALPSDPERALAITSEQARTYPSGEFIQEREVIAVEALARMGQKDEAFRRARALVHRFPRTPYGDRLEMAVGRAL